MVARYSDAVKLQHAKAIAKENNCFVVEKLVKAKKVYLLYRIWQPRNIFVGRRSTIDGILSLVKTSAESV
jgi:hypothetical protein